MSQINFKALVLSGLLLPLTGCGFNPFATQLQEVAAQSVDVPAQECPAVCNAQAQTPNLREFVERQESSVGLQLGAFKEPARASQLIKRLSQTYPVVFEGKTPIIRAIERDGSTLYRVILGPFSEAGVGEAFCKLLRQNSEACFVTTFDRVDLRVERVASSS